jgi:hypothetical protein
MKEATAPTHINPNDRVAFRKHMLQSNLTTKASMYNYEVLALNTNWNALLTLNFHNKFIAEHKMMDRLDDLDAAVNRILTNGHSNRPNRRKLMWKFLARPEISPSGERHVHMLALIHPDVCHRIFERCGSETSGYRPTKKVRDLVAGIGQHNATLHMNKKNPTRLDIIKYASYSEKGWKKNDFEAKNISSKQLFTQRIITSHALHPSAKELMMR